ncbi:MAG: response regulator transcription factor [Bacteroidales bacterium]|nr:response regulator transcription factor [Bacteroidales bacterium]
MKNKNKSRIIRLLVVEDNATLVLAGLRNFFRPERDMIQVCESASTPEVAIELTGDEFDVILLDLMIPDRTPGKNLSMLKTRFPWKPVVIYTSIDSDLWRKRMFSLGAQGYVHKNESRNMLKRAIMDAFEGKVTLQTVPDNHAETVLFTSGMGDDSLTLAEKEMLAMLVDGMKYKQIGKALNMSDIAIETAVKKIRKKFGANSTPQLIHILTERGLL